MVGKEQFVGEILRLDGGHLGAYDLAVLDRVAAEVAAAELLQALDQLHLDMRARHRRRHGRHKLNGLADQFAQAGDGLGLLRQSQHGGQKNHLSRGVERVDSLSHLGEVLVVAQILGDVGGAQLTRRVAGEVERIGGKLLPVPPPP